MPLTEAQKRAMKKYQEKNREKCRELLNNWRREHLDIYKEQQRNNVRNYRLRQKAKKEFELLCSMDLF